MDKKSAVLKFIERERAEGATDQEIQHHLLDAGWHMDIIQRAMGAELSHKTNNHTPEKRKLDVRRIQLLAAGLALIFLMLLAVFI